MRLSQLEGNRFQRARLQSQQISESHQPGTQGVQASDRAVWYRWERPGEAVGRRLTMEGMWSFGMIIGSCRCSEHLEQEGGM